MKKYCFFFLWIFILLLNAGLSYGQELGQAVAASQWRFVAISQNKLFSGENGLTRDQTIQKFLGTRIEKSPDLLMVKYESTFEDEVLCMLPDYRVKSEMPIKMWSSQASVDLYRKLLREGGVSLQEHVSVILPKNDKNNCLAPFNEIYEVENTFIVVTDEGYLLFFKQVPVAEVVKKKTDGLGWGAAWIDSPLILEEINNSCLLIEQVKNEESECVLNALYSEEDLLEVFKGLDDNETVFWDKKNGIDYFLKRNRVEDANDGLFLSEVVLLSKKDGRLIDQITLYKEQIYPEATSVSTQVFFVNEGFNRIKTLEMLDSEGEGVLARSWKDYEITPQGRFVLQESMTCDYSFNEKNEYVGICE